MAAVYKRKWKYKKPDGTVERRESKRYTIEYRDLDGRLRRVRGERDLKSSNAIATDLERQASQGRAGFLDPYREHRGRAFGETVTTYIAHLTSRGLDDKYRSNVERRLARLGKECRWKTIGDVKAESFVAWRGRQQGLAARTLNQWREAAFSFCNWLGRIQKWLPRNPMEDVAKASGDEKRVRRSLSENEIDVLLASVPDERRIVYEFCLNTGLRAQEATDLEWQDVRMDSTTPHLCLRSRKVKARREQVIPLRADMLERLRAMRPEHATEANRVFPRVPSLLVWQADLRRARKGWIEAAGEDAAERGRRERSDFLKYKDAAGRQADRHAMRTTLGTRLSAAGVAPRMAQELLRHSDLRQTMKHYTDVKAFPLVGAIESLSSVCAKPAATTPAVGNAQITTQTA